jgi:hypothetical protein
MSVVSVKPLHERQRSQYRDSKFAYSLVWLVVCSEITDGSATALHADGIPVAGDVFIDVAGNVAALTSIDVDLHGNGDRQFEVLCEFDTTVGGDNDDNPLDQPWGYNYTYQESTENYFIDRSDPNGDTGTANKPVVNSAGDAFQQFMTRENGMLVITLTRNVSSYSPANLDQYKHTVNMAPVTIDGTSYATGTLKLSPITATKNTVTLKNLTTVTYYAETLTFKARHEGWNQTVLDVGFHTLVGTKSNNTQSIQPIVDANGTPVTTPWPLDGTGHAKPNSTDTPANLTFSPYFAFLDWTPLSIS